MKSHRNRLIIFLCIVIGMWTYPPPAGSISVKQEKELSKEVIDIINKRYTLVTDSIVVEYVRKIGNAILAVLPPQPYKFRFFVIEDDQYNAFATPGGYIFFNSGMISAFENEAELAGVLAHEIAHVVCRHISQKVDRSKKLSMAALAGLAAGVLLGLGGAAAAGQAVTAGAAAATQSAMLSYSRDDESQADQLGLTYLVKAGYGGKGLMTSLEKIRSKQWFGSDQIPTYLSTHPASEDRITSIDNWIESHNGKGNPTISIDPDPFRMVRTRLVALLGDETIAMQTFRSAVEKAPDDPIAHYGYALILARTGDRVAAISHLKQALFKRAFDPYLLTEIGRVYYLQGRYPEAVDALEGAASLKPDHPDALFYLAKTYMEMDKLPKAADLLEQLIEKSPQYPLTRYALAEAYGKQGDKGLAHYHLGHHYLGKKDYKNALFHLKRASTMIDDTGRLKEIKKTVKQVEGRLAEARKQKLR